MRCPQECRLCPEKILTDDDKRPCAGGRRLGLVGGPSAQGREGGERFYLERSVLPWKTQDPKGRQPFLGQAGHRPGTGRHVCLLRKQAGLSLSL